MVRKDNPVNSGSDFFSPATNERVQGTKILIIVHHVITKIIVRDFFPRGATHFWRIFFQINFAGWWRFLIPKCIAPEGRRLGEIIVHHVITKIMVRILFRSCSVPEEKMVPEESDMGR
jgi:hypothetical protein